MSNYYGSVREDEAPKPPIPIPLAIGAVLVLLALVAWWGFKVMNQNQEGVTSPADARKMMMNRMNRGGSPSGGSTHAATPPVSP